MKKFNLKEYLENPNQKIITRDGRNVRIICTNRKGTDFTILALVQSPIDVDEDLYSYLEDGLFSKSETTPRDLFFAPNKKEGWMSIYRMDNGDLIPGRIYSSKDVAESMAKQCGIGQYYVTTIKIEWEE